MIHNKYLGGGFPPIKPIKNIMKYQEEREYSIKKIISISDILKKKELSNYTKENYMDESQYDLLKKYL